MSESSRYQNALRYAPGRSIGQYPDSRDITQLPIVPVGSRTPIRYQPTITQVATTDPVLLAAPPEQTYEMAPYLPQEPFVPQAQTAGDVGAPGTDFMALAARYGPRIAEELWKRFKPDNLPPLDPQGWAASLPADHIAFTGFGFDPLPSDTGIFIPTMSDVGGVGPVGGGDVVDAMNLTRGGLGFGGDFGADAAGGTLDKIGGAGGEASGGWGGFDASSLGTAGLSAIGGFLGGNLARSMYPNNGSPQNIDYGTQFGGALGGVAAGVGGAAAGVAAGSAMGSFLPVVGTAIGALIGGIAGGSINPQPDYKQAFAQFGVGPDGQMTGVGIQRNNAGQDVADNLALQAQQYFGDLAAQRGYTPNAAMMNQGFRFGVGQGDNMLGGWFLQPFAGDPNMADVRPDMWGLTVQDPAMRAQVAADVAANYRPGDNFFFAGTDNAGQRGAEFTRAPASMQEALDLGFQRLVDLGYYAPPGGPSPQDVQANIAAQQAYAAANPQQMWVDGDSGGWAPMPIYDNFTYQAGWQAPNSAPAGLMPGDPGWTASIAMPGEASWIDPGQSNG